MPIACSTRNSSLAGPPRMPAWLASSFLRQGHFRMLMPANVSKKKRRREMLPDARQHADRIPHRSLSVLAPAVSPHQQFHNIGRILRVFSAAETPSPAGKIAATLRRPKSLKKPQSALRNGTPPPLESPLGERFSPRLTIPPHGAQVTQHAGCGLGPPAALILFW